MIEFIIALMICTFIPLSIISILYIFCVPRELKRVSTEEIVRRMSNEMNFQNQRINDLQMQISDLNDVNRKKLEKRRVKIAKRRI
jgi:predicted N-acyltransferase